LGHAQKKNLAITDEICELTFYVD